MKVWLLPDGKPWWSLRTKANVKNQDNEPALPSIKLAVKLHQQKEPSIYFQSRETQESFPIITLTTNTVEIDIIKPMELELD